MKISSIAVAATAFVHLKGPDGVALYDGDKKVGVEVYSPGSAQAAKVEERVSARVERMMADNDNKFTLAPLDQRRADAADDLADMTAAFHHLEYDGPDGQPLAGRDLYRAVYADPKLGWIREQVQKVVGAWGKFSAASPIS